MTIQEFIKAHGITGTIKRIETRPDQGINDDAEWNRTANHYRVRIRKGKKSFQTYYSTGSGWTKDPELSDVLDSLGSDCSSVEFENFQGFCKEFGYDTDSLRALRTYKACERVSKRLKDMLGDAVQTLMYDVERL